MQSWIDEAIKRCTFPDVLLVTKCMTCSNPLCLCLISSISAHASIMNLCWWTSLQNSIISSTSPNLRVTTEGLLFSYGITPPVLHCIANPARRLCWMGQASMYQLLFRTFSWPVHGCLIAAGYILVSRFKPKKIRPYRTNNGKENFKMSTRHLSALVTSVASRKVLRASKKAAELGFMVMMYRSTWV